MEGIVQILARLRRLELITRIVNLWTATQKFLQSDDLPTLGTEVLTNGDFATDLSGWTADPGWTWADGAAVHDGVGTDTLEQNIVVINGLVYLLSITIEAGTVPGVTITFQDTPGFSVFVDEVGT